MREFSNIQKIMAEEDLNINFMWPQRAELLPPKRKSFLIIRSMRKWNKLPVKVRTLGNVKQMFLSFFKIYIFFFREGKGGRKRGKHQCAVASHTPPTGEPGLQRRHVSWLGIQPVTLWSTGQHSIHWATPARAKQMLKCSFYEDCSGESHTG